jgi:hypothetical protein
LAVASEAHPRRVERPQRLQAESLVALDLREAVTAQRDVAVDRLPEAHRRHLGIGHPVEDPPGGRGVVDVGALVALRVAAVHGQRQRPLNGRTTHAPADSALARYLQSGP